MKKRWIVLPACLLLLFLLISPVMAQGIRVIINNREISFAQPPVMLNGNVMVPMRGIFEELGADVKWQASSQTITARKDATEILIRIGSTFASVNGKTQQLSTPTAMVGGSTMVPLRFISEALGAGVQWQAASRTVTISSAGGSDPTSYNQPASYNTPAATTPDPSRKKPRISNVSHNASARECHHRHPHR
jgi:hypothetical protein